MNWEASGIRKDHLGSQIICTETVSGQFSTTQANKGGLRIFEGATTTYSLRAGMDIIEGTRMLGACDIQIYSEQQWLNNNLGGCWGGGNPPHNNGPYIVSPDGSLSGTWNGTGPFGQSCQISWNLHLVE